MALPYFLRNLLPRREQRVHSKPLLQVLGSLSWLQWAQFFAGWLAWSCDAIDFFSVSLNTSSLQVEFNKTTAQITEAITLTLLLRTVGALFFGIISDRYGRKWPLVMNLIMISVLELAVGFVHTFPQFLAVRALFGIGMGGVWGLAASTALETLPVEARGLASGVLQQGYACGYLLAACVTLKLEPNVRYGWRSVFWVCAGISGFSALLRALLPESEVFLRAKALEQGKTSSSEKTRIFLRETKEMLKRHWLLCIYAVLLMAGFNFLSHGSQDLYPSYMEKSKGFDQYHATVATIIGNCFLGRRLTIVSFLLLVGAFIPLWILPSSFSALSAGAFCLQFGVQGAWGVIPIQLAEMSPPAFRATFPGVAYQLGNMISAASAQIEAVGGAQNMIMLNGKLVPDYAKVQGIFIGVVAAYVIIVTILGPENHGSHFEQHKAAFEEGAGVDSAIEDDNGEQGSRSSVQEKGNAEIEYKA
ncbi:hypothetical protein M378DRAFT_1031639 [Amanita muscaria Koide BX008]|uniref:Major facilitator superfamily (MFS) profile domain-containing protein n=1 Tax=Amanita muscaria (strain Koide BX008) TaxID=946122 RepID=A0A0C2S2W2_AMAMK|nr:hypothetical protein M378DRAFT_1031639 [Amanita muscaria Koide BX008]